MIDFLSKREQIRSLSVSVLKPKKIYFHTAVSFRYWYLYHKENSLERNH